MNYNIQDNTQSVIAIIRDAWLNTLCVDSVDDNDNFFRLGGTSLQAMQMLWMVCNELDIEIPSAHIFAELTIAKMAQFLTSDMPQDNIIQLQPNTVDLASLPLSYAQQRLWFVDRMDNANANYNEPLSFHLQGALDVDQLQYSFSAVIERHESLRTNFIEVDGFACQKINSNFVFRLERETLTLSDNPVDDFNRCISQTAYRVFDLSKDLLIRAKLFEYGFQQWLLVIVQHHIVMDGWSVGVLLKDLSEAYQGKNLPPLYLQYRDYAHWQRELFASDYLDKSLEYWHKQLKDLPVVHGLSLDRERSTSQTFNGKVFRQKLAPMLCDRLTRLCVSEDTTLFVALHTTLTILLSRYSGESDIVVGTPFSGRIQQEVADMVGFFVNTVVLRTSVNDSQSFIQQLRDNRRVFLDALEHQHVPFELLVEQLQPAREMAVNPLFQVLFAMQNNEKSPLVLGAVSVDSVAISFEKAKFDLSLHVLGEGNDLTLLWEFNTDLFDTQTIERLGSHYVNLLESALSDNHTPVNRLALVNKDQQAELQSLGRCEREIPTPSSLISLFTQQADKTPNASAVKSGSRVLTYSELDQQSTHLASYLLKNYDLNNARLGLYFERSVEVVIATLAILKAGCAYVPMDPRYPQSRLEYIVQDTGLRTILSHSLLDPLTIDGVNIVAIDQLTLPQANPLSPIIGPDDIAYIVYTSGSTGKPKGIAMPHGVLGRLFVGLSQDYDVLSQSLNMLQYASIAFDMYCADLFMAFVSGGCVQMLEQEQLLDIDRLPDLMLLEQTQWVNFPYAVLQVFCSRVNAAGLLLPNLRGVVSTAEQLRITPDIRIFFARHPQACLLNLYGPAETHVVSSYLLTGDPHRWPNLPPVGKAVNNVKLHILDANRFPVAPGVKGELYIEGALSAGYLNLPEENLKKFVELPLFDSEPRSLYRSGDIVRFGDKGEVLYIGRADHQVKIRGFRIELGEIEAWLLKHPKVREAYVRIIGQEPEQKRIVAWIVTSHPKNVADVRFFLKQNLPDYMIPSAIESMSELPLNANGKVDHSKLPQVQDNAVGRMTAQNDIELEVQRIWQRVLDKSEKLPIPFDSDFFSLGGHSLLLTRLNSAIERQFCISLGIKVLFENKTVESQAKLITEADQKQLPEIGHRPAGTAAVLSYEQQRMWFIDRYNDGHANYNIPSVWRLTGRLDLAKLQQAFERLIARHEILRTVYKAIEGSNQVLQQVVALPAFTLNIADLTSMESNLQEFMLEQKVKECVNHQFDLSRDLPIKVNIIQLDDQTQILVLNLHHIATDGWSMAIIFEQLNDFYNETDALQNSPLQYSDYSYYQQQLLNGDILKKQMDYWQTQLQDLPFAHRIPLDFKRPVKLNYSGRVHRTKIEPKLTQALVALGRAQDATLFMVLQAAFSIFLNRWSNEEDIVFGTAVAGRTHAELHDMIGLFVNTLVLRHDLSGTPSFVELLAQAKSVSLAAFDHQLLPFEMLVEQLAPVRSLNVTPLFQIMLALHNNEQSAPQFANVQAVPESFEYDVAKFDLTLHVVQEIDGLSMNWEYNTGLFMSATVARFAELFQILLAAIVANPMQSIHQLEMLTAPEKALFEQQMNTPELSHSQIAPWFYRQASETPDAIAVHYQTQSIDYRTLNERSNQLARLLLSNGLKSTEPVGIFLDRSIAMVVGMLAIIKAGGVYVPLDSSYPQERLLFIAEDTSLEILLCAEHTTPPLLSKINIELDAMGITAQMLEMPTSDLAVTDNELAYIMYTSGSTGQPKGVLVPHSGVVRLVKDADYFPFSPDSRILQCANTAFDATTFEVWGALLNGGVLILYPDHYVDIAKFNEVIEHHQVNGMFLTTALFEQWCQFAQVVPSCLRTLMVGGAVVTAESVASFYRLSDSVNVLNIYGPTENTTFSTYFPVPRNYSADSLPIGKTIRGTGAFVVNKELMPVPVGALGELMLTGTGLAQGYLNRPEQTEQKFVSFLRENGEAIKAYRSGDIVSRGFDGLISYQGRNDGQVKIRGFRIEPEEVSARLNQLEWVRQATVVVRDDDRKGKQLVAYLVAEEINATTLRRQTHQALKAVLPPFMLPSAYVIVSALPVTTNGKYDFAKLSAPGDDDYPVGEFVAPRTSTERVLCDVWQSLMSLDNVSITADFFELGGHSLLAVRLLTELGERTGYSLSLNELFELRTIEAIAQKLERTQINDAAFDSLHDAEEIEW